MKHPSHLPLASLLTVQGAPPSPARPPTRHDASARRVHIIAALLSASDIQLAVHAHGGPLDLLEIHAFQAAALDPGQRQQLDAYLTATGLGSRVVLHPEALAASNGTLLVNSKGVTRGDAALADIAAVLVAPDAGQDVKIARWRPRYEAAWAPWRAARPRPEGLLEDPGADVEVQVCCRIHDT